MKIKEFIFGMEWPSEFDQNECVEAYCYFCMITSASSMESACALLSDECMFAQMQRAPTPRRIDAVVAVRDTAIAHREAVTPKRKAQHAVLMPYFHQ